MATWSLVLFQAAAFLFDRGVDTVPVNVNDDPARLFKLERPQWLAVCGSCPTADERAIRRSGALSALSLPGPARAIG